MVNEHAIKIMGSNLIYSVEGYITYTYKDNIFFVIAKLTYELYANESYQYIFEPYYDILDAFPNLDIPGIDLTLREKQYYRSNMTPIFISERTIPKNRVNLREELDASNIDYYQPFLLTLDSKKIYGGDQLTLKSKSFFQDIIEKEIDTNDIYKTISSVLRKLATRELMTIGNLIVDDHNRTDLIKNYLFLFDKVSKYYDHKSKDSPGRKKQTVSFVILKEIQKRYLNGIISIEEAVKQSGLGSKRTFYRRLKELNELNSINN